MVPVGVKLEINPEIIRKLSSGNEKLWIAAHEDGSDNRINQEAIIKASEYDVEITALTAAFQWARKLFRNRNKTREDLAAEKEAARINRTCGALEEMLLEYLQSAQEGSVDGETLDDLIETLAEMQGYDQSGKLAVSGREDLAEIRKSIEQYTAAMEEKETKAPALKTENPEADEFCLIREQLLRQKELIAR